MFTLYYKSKKKLRRSTVIGYLIVLLITILPMLSVVLAAVIANSHDCELNEGTPHPCIIGGTDYGGILYFLGVMGWFFMVSIPFGIAGLIFWTNRVRAGNLFLRNGAWYKLSELKNLTSSEFDGRIYLDAGIEKDGRIQQSRIFFKNITEQRKFSYRRGNAIGGLLKYENDGGMLILYDSIVR